MGNEFSMLRFKSIVLKVWVGKSCNPSADDTLRKEMDAGKALAELCLPSTTLPIYLFCRARDLGQ